VATGACPDTGETRRYIYTRTHFSEKSVPPLNARWGYLFPHLEQKGWAGLEPETPKPLLDLKQKRGGQAFSHLKWPGIGQNELAGGPKVLLTATFWPTTFPRARFHCPTFSPLFYLGRGSWPSNGDAPIEMREKMQRAWTWPFSVPDGFCREWVLGAIAGHTADWNAGS
jgi:hypothetical protein